MKNDKIQDTGQSVASVASSGKVAFNIFFGCLFGIAIAVMVAYEAVWEANTAAFAEFVSDSRLVTASVDYRIKSSEDSLKSLGAILQLSPAAGQSDSDFFRSSFRASPPSRVDLGLAVIFEDAVVGLDSRVHWINAVSADGPREDAAKVLAPYLTSLLVKDCTPEPSNPESGKQDSSAFGSGVSLSLAGSALPKEIEESLGFETGLHALLDARRTQEEGLIVHIFFDLDQLLSTLPGVPRGISMVASPVNIIDKAEMNKAHSADHVAMVSNVADDSNYVTSEIVSFAGQPIMLTIVGEPSAYPSDYHHAVIGAAVVLAITMVIVYIFWSQQARAGRIATIVARRTSALRAAHEELERHYSMLQRLNMDLEDSRKTAETANAAKSEFLATMSHELRTPLNAILGFSQIIREETLGPVGDDRYKDYASDINESGSYLLSLINDILDLAKLEAGKIQLEFATLRPHELAEKVLVLTSQSAEMRDLKVDVDVDPNLPETLMGDEMRIRQILLNLVSNAVKFTPEGSITIRFYCQALAGGSPGWVMEVEDTGVGIPADKLDSLFERFTQAESSRIRKQGGAGLGLAICRELADKMNGSVHVESEVDKGSVFRVHLPLYLADSPDQDNGFI